MSVSVPGEITYLFVSLFQAELDALAASLEGVTTTESSTDDNALQDSKSSNKDSQVRLSLSAPLLLKLASPFNCFDF